MKFTVGYRIMESDAFLQSMIKNKEHIYEVYFAFGDTPNGRNAQTVREGMLPHEAQAIQLQDLERLSTAGIPLNILYNGNCYGKDSESRAFFDFVGDTLDYLAEKFTLSSVTTTSPLIAKFVKANFPALKTRASVNMEIGTVQGMDYLADVFDGYYMKREHNRNLPVIKRLKGWCDQNGKELFMLANSGCLNDCSSHIFHDNLVAHEKEISAMDNAYRFRGSCWDYIAKTEKRVSLVRDTNYVRPEDIDLYEGYFTAVKLATRVNSAPTRVLESYIRRKHIGSVLDLLEPNHSGAIYPSFLDNRRFPEDFARVVATCDKQCETCGYCENVFKNAIINLEETPLC